MSGQAALVAEACPDCMLACAADRASSADSSASGASLFAAGSARQLQCLSCSKRMPACHADKAVKEDGDSDKRGWFANLLSGPGSTVALAFLCNKALLPVRVPITVGLTPAVAR